MAQILIQFTPTSFQQAIDDADAFVAGGLAPAVKEMLSKLTPVPGQPSSWQVKGSSNPATYTIQCVPDKPTS